MTIKTKLMTQTKNVIIEKIQRHYGDIIAIHSTLL